MNGYFHMQNFFTHIVDMIFPPSIETRLVRELHESVTDRLYLPSQVGNIEALTRFKDPYVTALIHEAKFHGNARAMEILGKILARHLSNIETKNMVLIPLPLHTLRERARGYNQMVEIARFTHSVLPTLVPATDALVRTKNTLPQTGLNKIERQANVADAFLVKNPNIISGKHIILLDDVVTTGATLGAAKAALLPHSPASITCIALAH